MRAGSVIFSFIVAGIGADLLAKDGRGFEHDGKLWREKHSFAGGGVDGYAFEAFFLFESSETGNNHGIAVAHRCGDYVGE